MADIENPLKVENETLKFMISSQRQQESLAIKIIGMIFVVAITLFVGLQALAFWQVRSSTERTEQRADEIISRTEREIDELLGRTRPNAAYVENALNDGSNIIVGHSWIYKQESSDQNSIVNSTWTVNVQIPAKIYVRGGSSGRLLGYEVRFSEELSEILYKDLPSLEARELSRQQKSVPTYEALGSEGVLVSPSAGYNINHMLYQNRKSCQEVAKIHKQLVESRNVGQVFLRPILQGGLNELDLQEGSFILRFVSASVYDCSDMDGLAAGGIAQPQFSTGSLDQ